MKVKVKSITGQDASETELPKVFSTVYRPDLIKRAVLSEQSKRRQPQGRYPLAGRLVAATGLRPGRGVSLIPRTHGSRTHHASRGTFIPSTRGGRLAHPPRVEKKIVEKMNKKEYAIALKSAVAATSDPELVVQRGHKIEEGLELPLVVEDSFTELKKTREVIDVLQKLGLGQDLERAKKKSIRAGKGKMRGRKYRRRKGPLIVVLDDCDAMKAADNIPGVDVCKVQNLTVDTLAPGAHAGRVTLWTESALKKLEEWK